MIRLIASRQVLVPTCITTAIGGEQHELVRFDRTRRNCDRWKRRHWSWHGSRVGRSWCHSLDLGTQLRKERGSAQDTGQRQLQCTAVRRCQPKIGIRCLQRDTRPARSRRRLFRQRRSRNRRPEALHRTDREELARSLRHEPVRGFSYIPSGHTPHDRTGAERRCVRPSGSDVEHRRAAWNGTSRALCGVESGG